jgi:formate dehydrogenase subunit gamma
VDFIEHRQDVWGREVVAGISWDLLWLVAAAALVAIIAHLLVSAFLQKTARPAPGGRRLTRHAAADRAFHWIMAASVFVLLFTGVLPILGVRFAWLTIHWVAGVILTLAVLFHMVRALFWQDAGSIWVAPRDLAELRGARAKSGKYSLAQKSMHLAMAVAVLAVIATGVILMTVIDTPWWSRSNWLDESTLGWMFVLHGASTLALVALIALHVYFALRPEKLFYTRAMIKGWISENELRAHHDPARWLPDETA